VNIRLRKSLSNRCIWQWLPQTYIYSLTKFNKSSKMYLTMTTTNVYSQFNKIRLWKSLSNTSYYFYYILLNCEYTFVEVLVKYILLLLLDLAKLWIYICGSPCQIYLTTFIRSFHSLTNCKKIVRYILQWLLQTYIHSLTRYNKSCKIYLTRTSSNV
jgi:hypothetical protein